MPMPFALMKLVDIKKVCSNALIHVLNKLMLHVSGLNRIHEEINILQVLGSHSGFSILKDLPAVFQMICDCDDMMI